MSPKDLTAACVVATAVFTGVGASTASAAPRPNMVIGTAGFAPPVSAMVRIAAYSDVDGGRPRGFFELQQNGQLRGSVSCVRVDGNLATVGGRVQSSTIAGVTAGQGYVQYVQGNGGTTDRSQTIFSTTPSRMCPRPVVPPFQVATGGYLVRQGSR